MKQRVRSFVLACVFCLGAAVPAFAAEQQAEIEAAAAYLREQGIYRGDSSGDLMLDKGLTRAELAVILTRLHGGSKVDPSIYTEDCYFTDVPAWAKPYIGYCAGNQLMSGYGGGAFGPDDLVTPAMACTVVLRACGIEDGGGSAWDYDTACAYAAGLGWLKETTALTDTITRGDMAVLIYRALTSAKPENVSSRGSGNGYLANSEPVTEENVLKLLRQIEKDWPRGTAWTGTTKNEVPSTEAGRVIASYQVSGAYGCGGYAAMVSSLLFGDAANPARKLEDLSQIRPGDILFRVNNRTGKVWHVTVALESPNEINAFHITDGNCNGTVHWPEPENPYGRDNLDCYRGEHADYHLEVWTRYPETVSYTGGSINAWPTGN